MPIASESSEIVMPGPGAHQLQRLLGAVAAAARPSTAAGASCSVRATLGCGGLSAAHAGECGGGLLEAIELFHQWAEFTQTCVYFLALFIQEVSH